MTVLNRSNFYVITGGSGGGKSTIIDLLKKKGFECVEEVGRSIVREQLRTGGDATPWQDQIKLRELILSGAIEAFEQVAEHTKPVFFDRGIPEGIGYSRFLNVAVPEHHQLAAAKYRYATNVFITPPWKEIYENDAERKQTWQEAVRDYEENVKVYTECGYRLIEVPKACVNERVEFILKHIN